MAARKAKTAQDGRGTAGGAALGVTVDPAEIARFSAIADEWWDPNGKFKPLHRFTPTRLEYIRGRIAGHFGRDALAPKPLAGLRLLDIGCGGGLLCEPMARLGASVVGADAAERNVKTAAVHAERQGLAIDYRHTTAEALAEAGELFDVVLNMEVVEHVADVAAFMGACARLVRPGGLMVVATLNRTAKAFALAIVGAEYVLGWLPRGTHTWSKFVKPDELERALADGGLDLVEFQGVSYDPLADRWRLTGDVAVNYMALATKRG
jgi:2-polyprenyl-6-hydroxyphenyl methylase/3-demethylubiquinone-9 3-methyltransferase